MIEPNEVRENQEQLANFHENTEPDINEFAFDYDAIKKMREGQERVKRQFSLTKGIDDALRDFLEIYTGTTPTRGKGIASAVIELFVAVCIAVIADFKIEEVAEDIKATITNSAVLQTMSRNFRRLADLLE